MNNHKELLSKLKPLVNSKNQWVDFSNYIDYVIEQLEVQFDSEGLTNVVKTVNGPLSGNYNGQYITETGPLTINVPAPNPSSYIAYDSLTKSDVLNFIKDTEQYITYVSVLTSTIKEKMIAPTQGLCALPW